MNIRSARGFSLVELMIVVAIIGILAAIAIPNFQRFQIKSRQSEARANLSAIYTAEKAFNAEWQQFYDDFIEVGYVPEGSFRYDHGFTAGVNSPANYTGAIGQAQPSSRPNTISGANGCDTAPNFRDIHPGAPVVNCSVDRAPTSGVVDQMLAATLTANTFFATAAGNVDDDLQNDVWQIDNSKRIYGPCTAAAALGCAADGGDLDN